MKKQKCRSCHEYLLLSNFTVSNGYRRRDCKECYNKKCREKYVGKKKGVVKAPAAVEWEYDELIQKKDELVTKLLAASSKMPDSNSFNLFEQTVFVLNDLTKAVLDLNEEAEDLNRQIIKLQENDSE